METRSYLVQRFGELLSFSLLWQTPWPKATWGRKSVFWLSYHSLSLREFGAETQIEQDRETRADTQIMEGCCLLACSSRLAQPAFLYIPITTCSEMALLIVHSALHVNHESRRCPTDLPAGNLMEAFSQLRFLSPDDSISCQIDKTHQYSKVRKGMWG